jgi:hypothetical protein
MMMTITTTMMMMATILMIIQRHHCALQACAALVISGDLARARRLLDEARSALPAEEQAEAERQYLFGA